MTTTLPGVATLLATFKDSGSPSSVTLQVCKQGVGNTFSNDIFVEYQEWVKYNGSALQNGTVAAAGKACSSNISLNTSAWVNGDGFGGDIMVVSPASCSYHWQWTCAEQAGVGCGSCWFGATSTLNRTCK